MISVYDVVAIIIVEIIKTRVSVVGSSADITTDISFSGLKSLFRHYRPTGFR
jgi:hypothetical protein